MVRATTIVVFLLQPTDLTVVADRAFRELLFRATDPIRLLRFPSDHNHAYNRAYGTGYAIP